MEPFNTPLKIREISLPHRAVFGPMAGFTDAPARRLMAQHGAGFTVSEMVSSRALVYGDHKTVSLLKAEPNGAPYGVQIFGEVPEIMGQAAAAVEQYAFDFLDINMGCPAPKIVSGGAGSKLMLDPDRCGRIVEEVVKNTSRPVTVKMRLGWDKGNIVCLDLAKMLESVGVAAITLHGRTKVQMYSGTANWDYIREVKHALSIPVIANGDVFSGQVAARILRYTGADGVMIARGVFGNPWIFQQAQAALRGEPIPPLPPLAQRCDTAVRQFELAAQNKGEKIACLEARKHYAWYLKGVPYAGYWKSEISKITTLADVYRVTAGIKRELRDGRGDG